MNQAQTTALVKGILNFVGGALVAHGATKAASIVNAEDTVGVVVFVVLWVYSHFFQHTNVKEATPTPMKDGTTLPPNL